MKRRAFLACMAGAMAVGCGGSGRMPRGFRTWGEQGFRDGHFVRPRAIGVDGGEVYVIDTTGRVQVFDEEGVFLRLWEVPDAANGTPTAIAFADADVVIPDTHYHQILEYTREGKLRRRWGAYGTEPGQFIYPTGIARNRAGEYFICEYGQGAQRVQVFGPARNPLRQWGGFGDGPGEFNRAMALALGPDELVYVADTANHRIQVFDQGGALLRHWGEAGNAPGKLKFPHDIAVSPGGKVLVAEYGSHRVSCFGEGGAWVSSHGRAGAGASGMNGPRGVAVGPGNRVYVADTDNHRVVSFEVEGLG